MRPHRLSIACLGASVVCSVLIVGGVLRWTQALVALLVCIGLVEHVISRRHFDGRTPLLVFLGIAITLTAIQLIPLPDGLVSMLSPTGHQLRKDGAEIAGTSPWSSVSLDPPATLHDLTYFIILFGVAMLAMRIAASERGRFLLLAGVTATCGLTAAVTGAHTLVHATNLYAIYEPQYATPGMVFGPLLNPNHLGGLMAMGTVLSLGLAFYIRQATSFRVLWVVTGIACTIVGAATLSRGAMVALISGLIVASILLIAGRSEAGKSVRHRLRSDLPIALVVVGGLAVAMYFSAGSTFEQLEATTLAEMDRPTSKYDAWASSLDLIRESPVLGIGRGATETTLQRVHPGSALATFADLENIYLSAIVEWGIPGALLLAGAFAWCVVRAFKRFRDGPLAAAAVGALTAILLQSGVDFGVELLGLGVPVIVIAATVLINPLRPSASRVRLVVSRVGMMCLLLLSAGLLLSRATNSVREDHAEIAGEGAVRIASLRECIERHPLDYVAFGEAASTAFRTNEPIAIEYLNHALRLHPTHPGLHRLAARMLVRARRFSQAALEYSFAMNGVTRPRTLLLEIVRVMPTTELAAASIPVTYPKREVMLHALADLEEQDVSIAWLLRVAERSADDLRVIDRLYELAIKRKDLNAAKLASTMRRRAADTTTSRLMHAKVLFARKDYDELIVELADVASWSGRNDEKAAAWFMLCDIHIERRDWTTALACLHRLDASMLAESRSGVAKRRQHIEEQRSAEAKKKSLELFEKSLNER